MRRLLSAVVGVMVLLLGFGLSTAGAVSINTSQDCDSNAVISCGISDSSQLLQAAKPSGIACLYEHFGISSQDLNNFNSQAAAGIVTRSGEVIVNGKVVAKDALTAGRQNMAGSTRFACNNHGFFIREPNVSFASSALPAFVVMRDGQFAFAIIASCGNPVMATPTTAPTPQKTVTKTAPARPTETPAPAQTQTQSQSVTINNTVPAVQAATTTAAPSQPAAAAKTLPNTGPGNILALSGTTTAIGTIGHMIYSRRRRSR